MKGNKIVSEDGKVEMSNLEFQFMMWLQIDGGIDTVEKYKNLTQKEFEELKLRFLKWYSSAASIDVGGLKK